MDNRRNFIKKTALLGAAGSTLLLNGCNRESKPPSKSVNINKNRKVKIKLATSWPAHFPIMGTGIDRFAQRVETISGGTIKIKVHPKNALVPAFGVFDAASVGAIDAYHSAAYFYKGKNEAFNLFTGFPFGMTSTEMNAWLDFGGGMELWRTLYDQHNLIPFKGGNTDVQMGGWFKKEITSLDDLQGLKMRIPGLGGEVFSKLGVQPIQLPPGEIFVALERNMLDATEWLGPSLDIKMGFHKVAKNYYTGWHEPGSMLSLVFNKKKFNKLSDEQKMMIEMASNELNSTMNTEFQYINATALEEIESLGVTVRSFPQEVMEKARQAMATVAKEKSLQSHDFQKVWESAQKFLHTSRKWSDIGLKSYMQVR
ncbi:MAG: TRAP transporter substrate-binding protein DctP [Epsilonproteobacteria bacterium]|nr:TRAP transporter substrate-binding protein DctP [Campylobacterota bacterium]